MNRRGRQGVVGLVRPLSLGLAVFLVAGCGALHAEESAVLAPGAGTGDCSSVEMPTGQTALFDASAYPAPAAGYARLAEPYGGWLLDHPASWSVLDFRLRGKQLMSFTPDPRSMLSPLRPDDQVMLHIEAWPNDDRLTVDSWLSKNFPAGGTNDIHSRATLTISGQPAVTMAAFERIGPGPYTETRLWWVSSPFFGRVYRIQMWPAEHPLLGEVQRIVGSFRIFAPEVVARPVRVSPALAADLGGRANPPMTRVTRTATKLVRFWDYENVTGAFTFGTPGTDPDTLLWVTVQSGDMDPSVLSTLRGLGPPPSLQPGGAYVISSVDAYSGSPSAAGGLGFGGGWPAFFDTLRDRCLRAGARASAAPWRSATTADEALARVQARSAELVRVDRSVVRLRHGAEVAALLGSTSPPGSAPIWAVAVWGQIRPASEPTRDRPCAVYFIGALGGAVLGTIAGEEATCVPFLK
ncbi:MAG TPA: hypothetical protein VGR87_01595 [Candidatus Limnocylindria bacterium]|nr:hypothetical protein [Candidatus Limnocylindria bacterium]